MRRVAAGAALVAVAGVAVVALVASAVPVLAAGPVGAQAAVPARAAGAAPAWLTAWTAAQQDPGPIGSLIPFDDGTGGRTVRDVMRVRATGPVVRVRLTNLFGTRALTFDDVRVGLAGPGAAVVTATSRRVTFAGRRRVTLARGQTVTSDPVARPVRFGQRLALSAYSRGATGSATTSGSLLHTNYVSTPGDAAGDTAPAAFTTTVHNWFYAAGIDVRAARPRRAVVALGASSTAGQGSTTDAGRSWPDLLADRLHARFPTVQLPVLNAGISGNALATSSPCFGQAAIERLDRDVLGQHGAGVVIVDLGANDILQPRQAHDGPLGPCDVRDVVPTAALERRFSELVERAHARGLSVIGSTIGPFGGSSGATADALAQRVELNDWISTGGTFDRVVDIAAVLADPVDPTRLNPALDSGDHLHPNDAGYAAMAQAIPLDALWP
jgi:lysophospholipase L1-like esterase